MDKKTIDTYNQLAKEYDKETTDFWERFPPTILEHFIKELNANAKVLDVGSGPGRDGVLLKNKGFDVTCVDASEEMVRLSTERGLRSIVGDFNELPFDDDSFDGTWSYTALLHVLKAEIDKPLSEIQRVLRRGGILGLGLIEGEGERYRENSDVNQARWFSYYTREELENLLQKHGFEIIYFEEFKPGSKKYLNFISKLIR